MSRRGNCYDNANAESFFSTLKLEHTYRHRSADHDLARQSTLEWIEAFYNHHRRHSSIAIACRLPSKIKTTDTHCAPSLQIEGNPTLFSQTPVAHNEDVDVWLFGTNLTAGPSIEG
jgi:hypothetical protein